MRTNVTEIYFHGEETAYADVHWQHDYTQILKFMDLDLPMAYEVDFANSGNAESKTMIGNADGVEVPDEYLATGKEINAYIVLHAGTDDGETVCKLTLQVKGRPARTDEQPTPHEQSVIEQAISALNAAVETTGQDVIDANAAKDAAETAQTAAETAQGKAEDAQAEAERAAENVHIYAEEAKEYAEDAEESAQSVLGLTADATVDSNVGTPSVSVSVTTESDHKNMSFAFRNLKGVQGDTGVGISSVVLNADYTLTITLTNGTSYTTSSIRGEVGATPNLTIGTVSTLPEGSQATATITGTDEDPVLNLGIPVGDTGDPGISPTITVTEITGGHEVEVVDAQGTQTFDVMDGEVSEQDLEDALIDKADVITSNASGEIVTIADGGKDLPVVDLKVSLLPIQDLHGQANPYPAGGGKNMLNPKLYVGGEYNPTVGTRWTLTESTNQFTANDDNSVFTLTTSSTWEYYVLLVPVVAGGIYRLTGSISSTGTLGTSLGYLTTDYEVMQKSNSTNASQTWNNNPTPTAENVGYYYILFTNRTTASVTITLTKPQFESGNTATAYAPYENVCPISGWTGVEVYQAKKNLLEPKFYSGIVYNPDVGAPAVTTLTDVTNTVTKEGNTYSKTGTAWGIPMSMVLPLTDAFVGKTLKFSGTINEISGYRCAWIITDSEYITKRKAITMSANPTWSITIQKGDAYLIWYMNSSSAGTYTLTEPQIEVGSTATAYEAFNGNTYPISWQSEAGTVYGGSLDLTTGVLTVDRVLETITDESDITYRANGIFQYQAADYFIKPRLSSIDLFLSNYLKPYAVLGYTGLTENYSIGFYNSTDGTRSKIVYFTLDKTTVTSVALAQAYLGNNPITFVYPLDTKVEYQLTPTQIATLLGTNNFWSNSNGVIDLEYRCDTKLYIENLTKPSEDDMTANANIASGRFFMIGNRLMLSTTAIAQGEQIVVGTNCSEVSLADALNQINS